MIKENNTVWKLLEDLTEKDGVSEIIINRPDVVFVERKGEFIQLDVKLSPKDIDQFLEEVAKLNKKNFNINVPIMDGLLADGSRINAVLSPFAKDGPAITIRKYNRNLISFEDVSGIFGLDTFWVTFLKALVRSKMNLIISGGTGVGKTTLLNMLINEIPKSERLITIEDTTELVIPHRNAVRLEVIHNMAQGSFLSVRDLVKNTLRMRPDRIIIGEVRGDEICDLFQAMNVGHEGSMTSIHANSSGECLGRMENLYLLAGHSVPVSVVRKYMAQAINFIIQITKLSNGQRIIGQISEITGMDGDVIQLSPIGTLDSHQNLVRTGFTPSVMKRLHQRSGLPLDFFS